METSWIVTWIIAALFGVPATIFVIKGLYLHYYGRTDVLTEELRSRVEELEQYKQQVDKTIEELEGKKKQVGEACEVSDIDWCLDDNRWRLQDIEWEIRDNKWEIRERHHQKRTSLATFWTVLGAALFAVTGLVVGIGGALIE